MTEENKEEVKQEVNEKEQEVQNEIHEEKKEDAESYDSKPTKALPLNGKDESLSTSAELKKSEDKKSSEDHEEDEFMALMKEDSDKKQEEKTNLGPLAKKHEKIEVVKEEPVKTDEDISLIKKKEEPKKAIVEEAYIEGEAVEGEPIIFALRTTANREDQVMDFVTSNAARKKLAVYSVIRPHGMRGYIFLETASRTDAEQAAFGVPYARGILPNIIQYNEIEHMLEQVKKEVNIQKNDIAEIISGPFKREKCKITRIDKSKEEVVVELLEAAVPIPITVKMDSVKVIRRDGKEDND